MKTVMLTVVLKIDTDKTDFSVDKIVAECDYSFSDEGGAILDSEIIDSETLDD